MNRRDIKVKLKALAYDPKDYWVIAGAAMALYGVREETADLDLGCTSALADRLEAEGLLYKTEPDGKRWFKPDGETEVFENWLYDTVVFVEGIPVISIPGLIEMKRRLGREKDLRDIALIEAFLANGKNGA